MDTRPTTRRASLRFLRPVTSKGWSALARQVAPVIVISMAVALTLTSCPWGNGAGFGDYDGVNLIASQGFGAANASTGEPWFLTPGLTAATADARDDGVTGVNYARWESTSGAGAYAPPTEAPDATVYRLEVVNLFQNGDFETGTAPAGWTPSGSGLPNADTATGGNAIAGNQSLLLDFLSSETRFHVDLANTSVGLADGFLIDTPYAFHIDFRIEGTTFGMELNDNTTGSVTQTWLIDREADSTINYAFPGRDRENPASSTSDHNLIVRDAANQDLTLLSFGGINDRAQRRVDGVFDNMRFVRSDQAHYLRLPVRYRESGRPEISGGGRYTFALWVKADPAAWNTADPSFGNRHPARHIAAGLDPTPHSVSVKKTVDTERHELSDVNDDLSSWHRLIWELPGNGINPPFPSSDDSIVFDIVLEIGNAIAGPAYQDAGSLLVAAPSLTWQP